MTGHLREDHPPAGPATSVLPGSDGQALCDRYDVALLDLDGVVYIGGQAVEHAARALAAARKSRMRLAFVTNNASRPPAAVAQLLSGLGVPATADEVITSAQAAAHQLSRDLPPGARVLVIGGEGLVQALTERGLSPVHSADDEPVAVVQGFAPGTDWALLAEACVAINRGVPWLATNLDLTVPSGRGPVLGNGSLVAAVRAATGVEPASTGKPDPTMHRETVERSGAHRPLVVGDRLDTDIEGASRVGCDSLLVLTGVTDARMLLEAPVRHRPTHVAHDLRGLLEAHPAVTASGPERTCGAANVTSSGSELHLTVVPGGSDPIDALRALCAAAWSGPARSDGDRRPSVVAGDDRAEHVLAELHLG